MVSRVLTRKLGRDLRTRKGSLAALLAIVVIGVGCFVGMASVYRDLEGSRRQYYTRYRLADFWIDLKRAPQWTVGQVAEIPNVRRARGRVHMAVRIQPNGWREPLPGTAISMPSDRRPRLNDLRLRTGTWFSGPEAREVILNHSFAEAHGIRPGRRIHVLLLDKLHELLVVGTAMSPEFVYLMPADGGLAPDPARFGVMYMPERFLQASCDLRGAFNEIIGLVHDRSSEAMARTNDRIERRMDAFGVTNTTPYDQQPSIRYLADELRGLRISAVVVPVLFLGVAALVLNVLMGRLVSQQRSVIGTLRALGLGRAAVTRHYVGYGLAVGLAGGLGGILLGLGIEHAMLGVYRPFFALPGIRPHFYTELYLGALGLSSAFAVLGTLKGVRMATRLTPAEAMRPPLPEKAGRVLPERIRPLWRRLGFAGRMSLRTMFRNPLRSGVSLLASAIATGLIVMAFSNMAALDYLMDYQFSRIVHHDIAVTLRDPKPLEAADEMAGLPGVSRVEPELTVPADLTNGARKKRVGVTGLMPGARMHTPLGEDGNLIRIPKRGLVLTRKLAELLGAGVGDRVRLRPLIGRREQTFAPVTAIVPTYLGLSAYADLRYLSGLLGERAVANTLKARLNRPEAPPGLLEQLQRRPAVVGMNRRVRSFEQLEETFGASMGAVLAVMILFAGMIAFGSVLNAAMVSLSERRREVGTLRVMGFTPC